MLTGWYALSTGLRPAAAETDHARVVHARHHGHNERYLMWRNGKNSRPP
jgi:hypothetical protein